MDNLQLSKLSIIHYPLSIIHYPLSIVKLFFHNFFRENNFAIIFQLNEIQAIGEV